MGTSLLADETFEFYGPVKMRDNPCWINITQLMQTGLGPFIERIYENDELRPLAGDYISRLNQILGIKNIKFHIEEVAGPDKSVDVVVDIFNRVNSGGTKLSKGDLALARVCAEWPDARQELRSALADWQRAGFNFKMDWLLRNINTVVTGEALFTALKDLTASEFQEGMERTTRAINYLLNVISGRLGLDHDRVLGGVYAFPVMTRYIVQSGGRLDNTQERDKLLYWYIHTFLWGRFAGSTESTLNQDLAVMEERDGVLDRLIEQLRLSRGDLAVRQEHFSTWGRGARFYPMLYLLTRVGEACDWSSGLPLKAGLLGRINKLQIHHIFPKSQLYKYGYEKVDVNALANFCFLTQDANLQISNTLPEVYFPQIEAKHPGVLASQWIPMDAELWKMENYLEFLAARRELLADAANRFLESLLKVDMPESEPVEAVDDVVLISGGIVDEAEEELILDVNIWVADEGLPEGELLYELTDEDDGQLLAILDLAWPDGLQTGFSDPVALLIDEDRETLELASGYGFRCFASVESFKEYVREEILVSAADIA